MNSIRLAFRGVVTVVALSVGMAISGSAMANEEAPAKPAAPANPGRPIPPPDPKSRVVPELVCTSERLLTINHEDLSTSTSDSPRRLRLRGNLVYMGNMNGNETFWGTINRTDRRRWSAATAVLVLDEDLRHGSWVDVQARNTFIRYLTCAAAETPKR